MKILTTFLASIFLLNIAVAQQQYTLNTSESSVVVQGTSTVHDWESNAENISGQAVFNFTEDSLETIPSLIFTVDASSIKSGKRVMDNKTKDALKYKDHPNISFNLGEIQMIGPDSVNAVGSLTLAGVTKEITLDGAYALTENGITVTGQKEINMKDYGIDPPTAMLGTLKTGELVTIVYNVQFSNK